MLTRLDIHDMVPAVTFAKGLQIHENGNMIFEFDVDENWNYDGFDGVSAFVEGSRDNFYMVDLNYNPYEDVLDYIECNCPAFETYGGPCKHCVAVMLEYSDYLQLNSRFVEDGMLFDLRRMRKAIPYREPKKTTTYAIKNLLNQNQHKLTLAFLQKDTFSSVRLEPEFHLYDEYGELKLNVGFKIGAERMYVLKNVYDFAQRMREKDNYSYGKKLAFVHSAENFETESKKMAEFICDWVENNPYPEYYGYYPGGKPSQREPQLKYKEIEDFFNLIGDNLIQGSADGSGEHMWCIRDGKPHMGMHIKTVDGGIEVNAESLPMIKGTKHYYLFDYRDGAYQIHRAEAKDMLQLDDFFYSLRVVEGKFFVEKEDVPMFCRELLPRLKKSMTVISKNFTKVITVWFPQNFPSIWTHRKSTVLPAKLSQLMMKRNTMCSSGIWTVNFAI